MGAKFARGLLLAAAGESEFASCCNFSFSESNKDEDNVTGVKSLLTNVNKKMVFFNEGFPKYKV